MLASLKFTGKIGYAGKLPMIYIKFIAAKQSKKLQQLNIYRTRVKLDAAVSWQ